MSVTDSERLEQIELRLREKMRVSSSGMLLTGREQDELLDDVAWLVGQLREAIPSEPTEAMVAAAVEASPFTMTLGMDDRPVPRHVVERMLRAALEARAAVPSGSPE